MNERFTDKPHLRSIEGGKEASPHKSRWEEWKKAGIELQKLASLRKLSRSLDEYLSSPPTEKEEKQIRIQKVREELRKIPENQYLHDEVLKRLIARIGDRPRISHQYTWRDDTEEQVTWDEQYMFEQAAVIAERRAGREEHAATLRDFEDHLTREAAKAYGEEEDTD